MGAKLSTPAFGLHGVGTVSGEALALQVVGSKGFPCVAWSARRTSLYDSRCLFPFLWQLDLCGFRAQLLQFLHQRRVFFLFILQKPQGDARLFF